MGFIRLVVFGFIALSIIYLSLSVYFRSVRRENLEDDWAEANPDSSDKAARDVFVADGMASYHGSIRAKLVGLVYVVPTIVVSVIVFMTNAN